MGWWRYWLMGDLGQQFDIGDLRTDVTSLRSQLRSETRTAGRSLDELRHENEELKLTLAAVVRLLIRKRVLAASEIESLIAELDAEDGTVDGRLEAPIVPPGLA